MNLILDCSIISFSTHFKQHISCFPLGFEFLCYYYFKAFGEIEVCHFSTKWWKFIKFVMNKLENEVSIIKLVNLKRSYYTNLQLSNFCLDIIVSKNLRKMFQHTFSRINNYFLNFVFKLFWITNQFVFDIHKPKFKQALWNFLILFKMIAVFICFVANLSFRDTLVCFVSIVDRLWRTFRGFYILCWICL